ncbi:MAG: hypothetical protein IH987_09135 [Planctomycetes bacterium]|nr:hypothetical protein [Planctomycetota bacterium]
MNKADIETLLPMVYQISARAGTPTNAILEVMAQMHAPSEAVLAGLERFFDPRRTDDGFVSFLAQWVDLGSLLGATTTEPISTGIGRLRELVCAATELSRWRGTVHGLRRFLEIATGRCDFEIVERPLDEAGRVRPFHLLVILPDELKAHHRLIEEIVRAERPAYVTYELEYAPQTAVAEALGSEGNKK